MTLRRAVLRGVLPLAVAAALWGSAWAQQREQTPRLPDGKSQHEAILKSEFAKAREEADELHRMTEELKIELEKGDHSVLSIATLKKTEEIEKLARKIRGRLNRR